MKIRNKTIYFIFFTAFFLCHTGCCEYTVTFGETPDDEFTYTGGGQEVITFWDLPLWIQVSWILSTIIGSIAAIKFLPLIAGKIRCALENAKRQSILDYVKEYPGRCIEELSDEMNINRETLRYHLGFLENNNHIVIEKVDHSKRIFPNHNVFSTKERRIISICQNPVQVKIIAQIAKYPGIRNTDLKDELGISKGAVTWHIKKMESAGILSVRKSGKSGHYYIKSGLESFVIENLPDDIKKNLDFERANLT